MTHRSGRFRPLVFVVLLGAGPALAQTGNLVTNGRFEVGTGIAGWTPHAGGYTALADIASDVAACAGSGAAQGTNSANTSVTGSSFYWTCLEGVVAGQQFASGGAFYFPVHTVAGNVTVQVNFFNLAGCAGSIVGGFATEPVYSGAIGWHRMRKDTGVAPASTASAQVSVLLVKNSSTDPSLEVYFDDILLVDPAWIYAEDFEVGDTCRWSAVVP